MRASFCEPMSAVSGRSVLPTVGDVAVAGGKTRLLRAALAMFGLVTALRSPASPESSTNSQTTVVVVVGAAGEEAYGRDFANWARQWGEAGEQAGAKQIVIGTSRTNETTDLECLKHVLAAEPKESLADLWLVLLGHGTFDGKEAKFNLRGPDLSATELAQDLKPFRRPLVVINCASSSGPFINALSAPGRVVITATKSGYELNYAHFGEYLSLAIADPKADLDKDGQTSLLEAFLTTSHRVAEFYASEGRLATEHALLDDNGDGFGTPADWFRGIRPVKKAEGGSSLDGLRAHQFHLVRSAQERAMPAEVRARRDALELAIARLREAKAQIPEDDYYRRLEELLLELARLYEPSGGPR